jgi:hypothetical protein
MAMDEKKPQLHRGTHLEFPLNFTAKTKKQMLGFQIEKKL